MKVTGTIRATLLKIKKLADAGSAGERENASRILGRRLDELNLTLLDLEEDQISRHWFTPNSKSEKMLLIHIIAKVIGVQTYAARGTYYRVTIGGKKVPKSIGVDLAEWEHVEVTYLYSAMLTSFRQCLGESRRVAELAFLDANNLLDDPSDEPTEMTQKELKMAVRAANLAAGMEPVRLPRKQLRNT